MWYPAAMKGDHIEHACSADVFTAEIMTGNVMTGWVGWFKVINTCACNDCGWTLLPHQLNQIQQLPGFVDNFNWSIRRTGNLRLVPRFCSCLGV